MNSILRPVAVAAERCLASGMSWVVTFFPGHAAAAAAAADCVLPLCAQPESTLPTACLSVYILLLRKVV